MDKELEAWEEVKSYIEYCLDLRKWCNATLWTSTYDFLKPFIDNVDEQIKAVEIIKRTGVCIEVVLGFTDYEAYCIYQSAMYDKVDITEEEYKLLTKIFGRKE